MASWPHRLLRSAPTPDLGRKFAAQVRGELFADPECRCQISTVCEAGGFQFRVGRIDGGPHRYEGLLLALPDGGFAITVDPYLANGISEETARHRIRFRLAHEIGHSFFFDRERTPAKHLDPPSAARGGNLVRALPPPFSFRALGCRENAANSFWPDQLEEALRRLPAGRQLRPGLLPAPTFRWRCSNGPEPRPNLRRLCASSGALVATPTSPNLLRSLRTGWLRPPLARKAAEGDPQLPTRRPPRRMSDHGVSLERGEISALTAFCPATSVGRGRGDDTRPPRLRAVAAA